MASFMLQILVHVLEENSIRVKRKGSEGKQVFRRGK